MTSDDRAAVVTAGRILEANGHSDYVWGHVSSRASGDRGFWMKASGLGFDEVTVDDVLLVDHEGTVIDGAGPRHAEWPIHSAILQARPDVGAVVHTHPPHAIALAAAGLPLTAVSHAGALFVPPDVPRFDLTSNLIRTPELGAALADVLGQAPAVMLVNHGIVVVGADLREAVVRAILLENACRQQLLATVDADSPLRLPSDDDALAKREVAWPRASIDSLWAYALRHLT